MIEVIPKEGHTIFDIFESKRTRIQKTNIHVEILTIPKEFNKPNSFDVRLDYQPEVASTLVSEWFWEKIKNKPVDMLKINDKAVETTEIDVKQAIKVMWDDTKNQDWEYELEQCPCCNAYCSDEVMNLTDEDISVCNNCAKLPHAQLMLCMKLSELSFCISTANDMLEIFGDLISEKNGANTTKQD